MKALFFFATISLTISCTAQVIDSLPPDTILYQHLNTYHQSLVSAQLAEFEIATKGNWMNYIPSVGVGYAPSGEPRPTMSFSLSQVFTAQRNRESIEAKRRAIIATATLFHQSEIRALSNLIRQYRILESDVQFAESIYQIDQQLFQFHEAQHQNHEITASQFLMKQRDFLLKQQSLKRLKDTLEEKRLEVMEMAKM